AYLAVRRFVEREAHVERTELDAVEVARDAPVGRDDERDRGVRVLIALRIVRVLKAEARRQLGDLGVPPDEERPGRGGERGVERLQHPVLLERGLRRRVLG